MAAYSASSSASATPSSSGERGVGPRPRHAELARLRREDALRHHGGDEGMLARGLGVDELVEAEPAHGPQHRIDVAVAARANDLQAVLDGSQLLTLQDAPDRLDLVERQRRQVGQRPLPDVLAVAHALAQQIGRSRVAVRDRVDVHDAHKPRFARSQAELRCRIHGYIPDRPLSRASAKRPNPPALGALRSIFEGGNFGLAEVWT